MFARFRKVPYVAQAELADCGAACLAMVLAYWGAPTPLADVRQRCKASRAGVSAYELALAARSYGLEVEALSLEPDALATLSPPAILHLNFNHFVVLERASRRGALVVDPAAGPRSASPHELDRSFTGVALTFRPGPAFRRTRPPRRKHPYAAFARERAPALALVLAASLLLELLGLALPAANQVLLDEIVRPARADWLWALGIALAAAVVLRAALVRVRGSVLERLQLALDLGLGARLTRHLVRLPLAFLQRRPPGQLFQDVQGAIALRETLSGRSVTAVLDGLLLVAYGALMLLYDARLGAVVVGLGAARALLLVVYTKRARRAVAGEVVAGGRAHGALLDALSAPEATRAFGAEAKAASAYADRLYERANAEAARKALAQHMNALNVAFDGAGRAAVALVGGALVVDDRMTLGVFGAFLMLQFLFTTPLESLAGALQDWQLALERLKRAEDVWGAAAEPEGGGDKAPPEGALEFDGVSFRYDPSGPPALDGVSFRVGRGEKVALVGRSGAGKSTVARLLLGLCEPSEGVVRVDGRPLASFDLTTLRNHVGLVPQQGFLFDDTVRANLSLYRPDLPLEALRAAARVAAVDGVIEALPGGYDTPLGPSGGRLSGGQRQRLAIARAVAHAPPVLVLDEATSSLDAETEAAVHARLRALPCTTLIIAHRLATVRDADRIYVLEGGKVADQGTFDELMGRPGPFLELARAGA